MAKPSLYSGFNRDKAVDWKGQLQLLILQPSPFCNLDCDYCYLPNRSDSSRMDLELLETAVARIFSAGLPSPELSVVWHAGEPLSIPRDWYEEAFARIASHCPQSITLTHHFQTNGVLIDANWLKFFCTHGVRVGVSIDGPAWLHNKHRRTRTGRGSHDRVMRGIEVLRQAGFPFHVICVLTRESLDHADEIVDFFNKLEILQLCFNLEENEGIYNQSSLSNVPEETEAAFRRFMVRIVDRVRGIRNDNLSNSATGLRIREIDDVLCALRHPHFGQQSGNSQNIPGQILSVAWDGSFWTGSPELLGQQAPGFGKLVLGNILRDSLPPAADDALFAGVWKMVRSGVETCRASCAYFDFCRGGSPSNKLGETNRFDVAETHYCRMAQQVVVDVVLDALDQDLPRNGKANSIWSKFSWLDRFKNALGNISILIRL